MKNKRYIINFEIEFDVGDGARIVNHGILQADHEVTEEELRNYKWREKGEIVSLKFSCKEVL